MARDGRVDGEPGRRRRLSVYGVLKTAAVDFGTDDAMAHGAAVAFYSALSLAPMLLLFLWGAGLMGEETQRGLAAQVQELAGPGAGDAVKEVIENAEDRPKAGTLAGLVGLATLLFSATGVFAQLQHALNVIWDVRARPTEGATAMVMAFVRKRLLSLGMVLTIGFLLLISTVASAALSAVVGAASGGSEAVLWKGVNVGVSLVVFTLLFAAMFRFLPDVHIPWRAVWFGAVVTASLFVAGKVLIGVYLGRGSVGSSYGAAGSLVALLVWVYYAALIVFVGAEITQAWAYGRGMDVRPEAHAEWADGEGGPGGAGERESWRERG